MKLTSVEIHPAGSSDVAVLSFRDPTATNPYNVKAIVGLDVDEIVPRYYGASGSSKFYSLSLQKRELVMKIGLNPDFSDNESYSDLRDNLYKMIASSRTGKLQLQFKMGVNPVAAVSGFVKKFEAPNFEKVQEVQITISCDEPMLKALTPVNVTVGGLNPASTTIQDDLSTAPHGFTFVMNITAAIASLGITDPGDSVWSFILAPIGGFLNGDVLYFSSETNNKYVYINRAGAIIFLADVIAPGSVWPILFPGENVFAFTHPTNVAWSLISHYPTYWGV